MSDLSVRNQNPLQTSPFIADKVNIQITSDFEWSGSGSGAGLPQCVQQTIARQIQLYHPCIGKGRFGEVYKGLWRDGTVAVKTFVSTDHESWEAEFNIYNLGLRHENILGFIAADHIDKGAYVESWLITEYHERGSLFDYLNTNTVTPEQTFAMSLSIVNGLAHLHMPIEGCVRKPALAHCDVKSKNILVKLDLTCCISDLGLTLLADKDGYIVRQGSKEIRTGTKRYMAPEILSKKIDSVYVESYQKADIYSLGLVFWELISRTMLARNKEDSTYRLPFYEYTVGEDVTEESLIKIVCENKDRPTWRDAWKQNNILNELILLTEELWTDASSERLSVLRLKKSLNKMKRSASNEK